jgi:TnpA family transposase
MPRRHILSARQRSALLDLPTDEAALLRHYLLADDDLIHIDRRRRPENRIGFALQLCALRYPGRTLAPGELIPHTVSAFLGAQLGIAGETLAAYAVRRQTRHQHMEALRRIYGYRMFPGRDRMPGLSAIGFSPKPSRHAQTTTLPGASLPAAVKP